MRIKRTIKIDPIKRAIENTNIYENKFNNLDEIENSLQNITYENCFIRKYKKLNNPTLKKLKS